MMKIYSRKDVHLFYCPACKRIHSFNDSWMYNKNAIKPTVTPSLKVTGKDENNNWEPFVCHSYISDGNILYLADCTHDYKNRSILLPNFQQSIDDNGIEVKQ